MSSVQDRHVEPSVEREAVVPRQSVVQRVMQVLDVFLVGPERLMLEDVAVMTGLPRSTAFRLMSQLVDLHWLEHDSRGYRLGARSQSLGARTDDHSDARSAAAGVLNRLHLGTGAVVHFGVLEGGLIYYLDKLGGPVLDSIPSTVGRRVPADTTPMGRAMLATLAPEQVDALTATTAHQPRRRPLDQSDLHNRLQACRQRNGIDVMRNGGRHRRIFALGAPVFGAGGLVASLGVASSDGRVVPEITAPLLVSAAQQLSDELGGGSSARRLFAGRRQRRGRLRASAR